MQSVILSEGFEPCGTDPEHGNPNICMTIHLLMMFLSAYPAWLQKILVDEETWGNLNTGDLANKNNNNDCHKYTKEYIIMNT